MEKWRDQDGKDAEEEGAGEQGESCVGADRQLTLMGSCIFLHLVISAFLRS